MKTYIQDTEDGFGVELVRKSDVDAAVERAARTLVDFTLDGTDCSKLRYRKMCETYEDIINKEFTND